MAGSAWTNQAVSLIIIQAGGTFQGLFMYSPTVGNGNLIASIAAADGTDPYGNAYLEGFQSQSSGVSAVMFQGLLELTWAAGAGGIVGLAAAAQPALVEVLVPGTNSDSPVLEISGPSANGAGTVYPIIQLNGMSEDGTAKPTVIFSNADSSTLPVQFTGPIQQARASGLTLMVADCETTSGGNPQYSIGNTAVAGVISPLLTIPANDAILGSVYEIEVMGNGRLGQVTNEAMTITLLLNGAQLTAAPCSTTIFSALAQNFAFTLRAVVTVVAAGSGGTVHGHLTGPIVNTSANRGANGPLEGTMEAGNVASFDTTASNTLQLQMGWAGAGGSDQAFTVYASALKRRGG